MFTSAVQQTARYSWRRSKPVVTYAIGDVHGQLDQLQALYASIFKHRAKTFPNHRLRLVHLGDYVDRGPDSAGVLEAVIEMTNHTGVEVVCLAGNHEDLMLRAMSKPHAQPFDTWMKEGGDATLSSYHHTNRYELIHKHLDWLKQRPRLFVDERHLCMYVHAGVIPGDYPNATSEACMWTRSAKFMNVKNWRNTRLSGWTVVHGHTPTSNFEPEVKKGGGTRVNVDTGAVFGGSLTCAIISPEGLQGFLHA